MWRRKRMMESLDQDIRDHIAIETQDNVERGMSPEEARYAAVRKFGNVTRIKEDTREVWSIVWLDQLLQDIRFGLHMLRKNPGFTAVAIMTLALGIAANATIFSAVSGWMLRPPTIKEPATVAVILTIDPTKEGWAWYRNPVSVPDFVDWRKQSHSFEDMVASEGGDFTLTGRGEPERLSGLRVSASYFDVMGVSPTLGRTFLPDEDQPGHDRVVILSHGLWQRLFASDRKVVGQTVRLDGETSTVVGVMPSSFRVNLYGPQLWTPLVFAPDSVLPAARENRTLYVLARLKSGVNLEAAKAEMASLAQRSEQSYPGTSKGWSATAMMLQRFNADEFKVGMPPLMGAVIFVLLIGCANIASLQLARATERQRELAVRAALGAGRFRLVRQLLAESLLLAFAGGALGLLLAYWGVDAFRSTLNWGDDVNAFALAIRIDRNVLAYTLGMSIFAAIVFGLAPALHQTAMDLHSTFKDGGRTSSQGKSRNRTHSVLVTAEIALTLVLLTGAGIYVQDFLDRFNAGFGIDANQVLTANISLPTTRYKEPSQQAAMFKDVMQHLEALPGVISAGATTTLVPGEDERVVTFSTAGQPALLRTKRAQTDYFAISPDYLRTLSVPLLRGRSFLPSDNAQATPVALVNLAFVQRFLPNEQPIGKHIRLDTSASDRSDWTEIVGIVGNVKDWSGERREMPQVYEPDLQRPSSVMTFVIRTSSDPAAFAPMLRQAVWDVDKDQPITRVQTMNRVITDYGAGGVVVTSLMGSSAGLGLALAVVGVFGVMAYTVARRAHEIGIRVALGAQRGDVLRMVMKRGIVLASLGVGIGLALAAPLMWLPPPGSAEEAIPFNQRIAVFLSAAFLIWLAALLASYLPARRATKVDPVVALRHE